MSSQEYTDSIRAWRDKYAAGLLEPEGWLAISGLFWLQQGENRAGADSANRVILPAEAAPDFAGTFTLNNGEITLQAAKGIQLTINDQPVKKQRVEVGSYGSSEWIVLHYGEEQRVKFSIIQRGSRYGVRVYDKKNRAIQQFINLHWYPVLPNYRIEASFIPCPCEQPHELSIVNVIGDTLQIEAVGYAEFMLHGVACRLTAIPTDDNRLWFMFRDATSKAFTYAGGRYLSADAAVDGKIWLDFNKAHNPPCAYTDFATCPLPPTENTLPVQVKAGEMKFLKPINA